MVVDPHSEALTGVAGTPAQRAEPSRSPAPGDVLSIGPLALPSRVMMAPMAGITTAAFRRSVRRWGAGLVFTEMISAYGIRYGNRRTLDYLASGADEHPIGYQLFGADPDVVAGAAVVCVEAGADLVDLNMACPVRKVVSTGAGAALLGDPERAVAMVVAGGAAALCLHPRTAAQLYRGAADHELTRTLAAELPVPVIASGDVDGRAACLDLLRLGAAGVMLARYALGSPWLFAEVLTGASPPAAAARLAELRTFVAEVELAMGPRAVGHLRQFWPRFRRSQTISRELSGALMRAPDVATVHALLVSA